MCQRRAPNFHDPTRFPSALQIFHSFGHVISPWSVSMRTVSTTISVITVSSDYPFISVVIRSAWTTSLRHWVTRRMTSTLFHWTLGICKSNSIDIKMFDVHLRTPCPLHCWWGQQIRNTFWFIIMMSAVMSQHANLFSVFKIIKHTEKFHHHVYRSSVIHVTRYKCQISDCFGHV